jgi:hypothetical protein
MVIMRMMWYALSTEGGPVQKRREMIIDMEMTRNNSRRQGEGKENLTATLHPPLRTWTDLHR